MSVIVAGQVVTQVLMEVLIGNSGAALTALAGCVLASIFILLFETLPASAFELDIAVFRHIAIVFFLSLLPDGFCNFLHRVKQLFGRCWPDEVPIAADSFTKIDGRDQRYF